MSWGTVISVAGSALGALASNKASKVKTPQIDIEALNRLVTGQSRSNAQESLALERELTPENQALRRAATQALLRSVTGGTPEQDQAINAVLSELASVSTPGFAQSLRSPVLESALQQAGADLALGGALPLDVRNQVTRRGISSAGRVGGGNLGTARAIVPRDLGLSSLALRDSRINRGLSAGATEADYNRSRATTATQARTTLASLLAGLAGNRLGQQLSLGSFAQSLQPPQVGLNPGNVADIYAGNLQNRYQGQQNKIALQNQAGQSVLQGLGSIFGSYLN